MYAGGSQAQVSVRWFCWRRQVHGLDLFTPR